MWLFVKEQKRTQLAESTSKSQRKIRCASCHTHLSEWKHLVAVHQATPFHKFTNPQGLVFRIFTVSHCLAIQNVSSPTTEHTWFSGYAWSVCICLGCGEHLGWSYYSANLQPHAFVGLIEGRAEFYDG